MIHVMDSMEIRKKFLDFFEQRGHKIVPSSSLIPDDPSVLLTTAGMQQFKSYLTAKADPMQIFGSRNVCSIQKSFRTTDIDEVGDDSHLTFFEMLGNFSFGGYFKERAIPLSFEFITSSDGLGLDSQKLYITVFRGDEEVPRDNEVIVLWQEQFNKVGIDARLGERIFLYGREKNWWEAGLGPAGPDAEMFYDFGTLHSSKFGPVCHPNCDCGRFVEIGNDVFVQYNKIPEGKYEPLEQKSVDNGRGFERLVMVVQGKKNIFETDLFIPLLVLLPSGVQERHKRIIVDHLRAASFLLADGMRPSNKEAGYILRRLLRRAFVYEKLYSLDVSVFEEIIRRVIENYGRFYPELKREQENIFAEFSKEKEKFSKTLERGIKQLQSFQESLTIKEAFGLYETFGLPYEIIKELAGERASQFTREDFDLEFKKHQEISRVGQKKKFGGHGMVVGDLTAANSEELKIKTRLHTATHLLNSALHKVLGDQVSQRGSDITIERTRFDFVFPRKLTEEELKKVEELVKEAIVKDFPVTVKEMPLVEAKSSGALFFYKGQYPNMVSVYTIGSEKEVFSKELCGGPHVKSTGEIGRFKIIKEESSSDGVRRIRAVIE